MTLPAHQPVNRQAPSAKRPTPTLYKSSTVSQETGVRGKREREKSSPDHADVIGQLRQLAESEGGRSLPELLVVDREDGQVALLTHCEARGLELAVAASSPHLHGSEDLTAINKVKKSLISALTSNKSRLFGSQRGHLPAGQLLPDTKHTKNIRNMF